MTYLLAEIVLYLLGAGFIGLVVGWLLKGGFQKKSSPANAQTLLSVEEEKEAGTEVVEKPELKLSIPELLDEPKEEGKDKLSTIKGIGPVIEKQLNELGIYHFEQIASWTKEEEEWVGMQMAFPKRVTNEAWVNQAKELLNNK